MELNVFDFEGIPVGCTAERWDEKVTRNHPELIGHENEVAMAIRDPALVFQDRDYAVRRHFIRGFGESLFLDVVVEYQRLPDGLRGRLVTAFLRTRLRLGDPLIYIRP